MKKSTRKPSRDIVSPEREGYNVLRPLRRLTLGEVEARNVPLTPVSAAMLAVFGKPEDRVEVSEYRKGVNEATDI